MHTNIRIKQVLFIALLLAGVIQAHSVSEIAQKAQISKPHPDPGTLALLHVPLMRDNGFLWIVEIPTRLYGLFPASMGDALSSPVYANSPEIADRKKDINLISLYKVSIKINERSEKHSFDLIIDISKATKPSNVPVGLNNVVLAALTCVRIECPPDYYKIYVKIIGRPDGLNLQSLEGELWQLTSVEERRSNKP